MFRLYIACLAAYNNAKLHGEWVEVSGDLEELQGEISRILSESPEPDAEEWAVHDHEGFGSYNVTEYPDLEEFCEHVTAYNESSYDHELINGVMDALNCSAIVAVAYIDDNYQGEYESLEWWAEELLNDLGELNLPKHLAYYFNYADYGRDMELNGEIISVKIGPKTHVLWNK
jgi:antirestriction protein